MTAPLAPSFGNAITKKLTAEIAQAEPQQQEVENAIAPLLPHGKVRLDAVARTGASITGSNTNTNSGWLVGAGIEWAFAPNWYQRAIPAQAKMDTPQNLPTHS